MLPRVVCQIKFPVALYVELVKENDKDTQMQLSYPSLLDHHDAVTLGLGSLNSKTNCRGRQGLVLMLPLMLTGSF